MSGPKRTKAPPARIDKAGGETAALDKAPEAVVPVDADEFDDILGEVVGPATPTKAIEAVPDEAPSGDFLEDILGALSEPAAASGNDPDDDLFGEVAAPPNPGLADRREDGSGAAAGQPPSDGNLSDTLAAAPAGEAAECGQDAPVKPGLRAKLRKQAARALPQLAGTREISRKAFAGGIGMIALLALVSAGQAAVILARPAASAGQGYHGAAQAPVAALPINYATVDLDRFIDKTRSLREGGRQILRNPAVKDAIIELDSGERLYQQIQSLAARSAAADLATIRNNRVRIASCNTPVCGDKMFQLTYDIKRRRAVACVTEKYLDGAYLSYSYGPGGYSEVPHCG